jgi:hypothetical protein
MRVLSLQLHTSLVAAGKRRETEGVGMQQKGGGRQAQKVVYGGVRGNTCITCEVQRGRHQAVQ